MPMNRTSKPRVVELFAGVGGFRLGLERSGWETVWANQWEPSTKKQHAFDCYVQHFGDDGAVCEDIHEVMNEAEAGLRAIPDHDLLVGGFGDDNLQAGGDILLRLPVEVDATLSLAAGGDLDVRIPGVDQGDEPLDALVLGDGSAPMSVSAGGDLLITSHADEWADMADFDISLPFIGSDFPGLPDDFAERISRHADEAARKAEKAARKVEIKMRRSEHKFREAERHAARAAARAARNAERHIRFGKHPIPPHPPRRPAPPAEPVSDQERMLILKMLEEKKITAAEAEKLLAAME